MAIDPATSWGLAPLGAPSQSTTPLAPQPVLSPELIAQARAHALALQEPPKEGIKHWTQGIAELLRAIQGNREASFASEQERANREATSGAMMGMLPPQTPSGATPAAGGAAAGNNPAISPAAVTPQADASQPRGIRNNNPLNIEDGQFAKSQPGYAGTDGRFAKFDTPQNGFTAANGLLNSYQTNHGLNTIEGIVSRWAPASDNNDTKAYAAHVAAQMGIGPNDPIPPEMRPKLLAAMATHENGKQFSPAAATPPVAASPAAPATQMAFAGNPAATPLPSAVTQGASMPGNPAMAAQVNAIAGRPMPAVGGGAPVAPPPVQVAGPPQAPGGPPSPAGGITPLMAPHASLDQLRATIADPRVPMEIKQAAVAQYNQLMQPQTLKVPRGNVQMIPGTGQYRFIPEEVPFKTKTGSTEIEGRGVYNPATGKYDTQMLTPPGGGAAAKSGEPDLSTIGGQQANEVAQAAAKKGAEEGASAQAKTYNVIHTGITGDAINAQRQAPVIDTLMKIAPAALTGTGSDAALALNRLSAQLGIDTKGAAPRELFNMLSAKILGDQFAGIRNMAQEEGSPGGKVFKAMFETEEKANITPEDSLAGVMAKLNYFKAMGKKVNDWADLADDYAQKNGHLDAGFMKTLRKDMGSAEFPSFTEEGTKGETAKAAPNSKVIGGKTYYQIGGKVYDNPEGK